MVSEDGIALVRGLSALADGRRWSNVLTGRLWYGLKWDIPRLALVWLCKIFTWIDVIRYLSLFQLIEKFSAYHEFAVT